MSNDVDSCDVRRFGNKTTVPLCENHKVCVPKVQRSRRKACIKSIAFQQWVLKNEGTGAHLEKKSFAEMLYAADADDLVDGVQIGPCPICELEKKFLEITLGEIDAKIQLDTFNCILGGNITFELCMSLCSCDLCFFMSIDGGRFGMGLVGENSEISSRTCSRVYSEPLNFIVEDIKPSSVGFPEPDPNRRTSKSMAATVQAPKRRRRREFKTQRKRKLHSNAKRQEKCARELAFNLETMSSNNGNGPTSTPQIEFGEEAVSEDLSENNDKLQLEKGIQICETIIKGLKSGVSFLTSCHDFRITMQVETKQSDLTTYMETFFANNKPGNQDEDSD